MKKLALFFAALVVAMASFAAIPTKSDLAPYYEPGQLCVCVQFEEQVCNDIVFAGSYNAWNTNPAEMAHFAPLKGFDGWYYVAVTDNSATIEGKPVQLRSDGSFSWDYQGGDAKAWTIHSGYVNILPGYNGECDLKNYATAEPIIMTCAYFKNHNTPCGQVVVSQTYTIRLKAPACIGADGTFYEPAIIGSFNGWAEGIAADHIDRNTSEYVFLIKDAVDGEFKFKALGDTDWSNEIQLQDELGNWYNPLNITLGTETEIRIDYSAGRYTKCVEDVIEDPIKDYTIRLLAPDCAGEDGTHYEPAIVGSFNGWTKGVAANYIDDKTGEYVFLITDSVGGAFKFRALGDTDWSNQIQLLDEEYGWWYDNYDQILGTDTEIHIDYSMGKYTLCVDDVVNDSIKTYTIRLLAPDCAGADGTHYEPAIIGSFNDWTEGMAANYIDDSTGEYVFLISDKEGGEFKFKALGDTAWTNEIQLQDELGNWYNPQNLPLESVTEIRIDYSAGRYTLCVEDAPPTSDIPTNADLAPYYEPGQLCVCIKFEEQVCNNIVFAGSYNGWNTIPAEMAHFAPLKGFDGWYYVAVTDNSATIEGKPVQLKADGSFSWDYQGGDAKAWTIHSGYVDILPGYNGECDLKNYANAEPIIMTCAYFKNHNSPCEAEVYQDYTIRLLAPSCAGADGTHYQPAIIGDFNNWTEGIAANDIDEETHEYVFLINAMAGSSFKFRALGDTDWSNEIILWDEISQYWYAPANIVLGTDTEISIDYSAGRYTKCVEDVIEDPIKDYTIRLLAPDCAGEDGTHYEPAIIGTFNDWTEGIAANYIDDKTGEYVFLITDSVGGAFKFRALGDTDWSNQIQLLDEEYGWWYDNYDQILGTDTEIHIDYSMGKYTLCVDDVVNDSIKTYTIRLLAPDCAGADGTHYQPAIIGTFNDWTEGVAANYIDEWTGEYVFTITDKVGGEFKFKALGDTDWTNEIQLQDELGNWYNPQNLTLGADTEISIDYSAGRYTLCQEEIITLDPIYVTICYGDTYYWYSNIYSKSGEYTVQFDNFIQTLYLTVLPEAIVSEENLTINETELPYIWHNQVLSTAGDYYDVTQYVQTGCDSIVYILHLNVEPAVVANQCGDNLYWTYEPSTQELSITGYGDMYNYTTWTQPWNTIVHAIRHITLPEGMTSIGTSAFADCMYTTSITIPTSVEIIADRAFENCRMLSDLTFAEGGALSMIGNWAFYNCHELKHIAIPEGVTEIGYAAFYGCTYLSELTLPASMEHIADNGFALCAKLTSMTVNATVPPTVAARTFEDVDRTIPVYVPQESVDLYKAAPVWQEFYIVGKVASSLENQPAATDNCQKLIRDGQLIIIHDGKTYNAMGQEL